MENLLLEKYKKYVSNVEWHIKTNKPDGEGLRRCKERLACYREIVHDLSTLPSDKMLTNDIDFLEDVLNHYWHFYNTQLQRKDLGDIEKKNYEKLTEKAKLLMDKISP